MIHELDYRCFKWILTVEMNRHFVRQIFVNCIFGTIYRCYPSIERRNVRFKIIQTPQHQPEQIFSIRKCRNTFVGAHHQVHQLLLQTLHRAGIRVHVSIFGSRRIEMVLRGQTHGVFALQGKWDLSFVVDKMAP